MQAFKQFPQGCTIFDVVLELYLTLNLLPKLIFDNGITNINEVTKTGQIFQYDTELIFNENMSDEIIKKKYNFRTSDFKQTNNVVFDEFLLIESSDILQDEANNLFLI
jgi:hypothetical protein